METKKRDWEIVKLGNVLNHRKGFIQIDDLEKYKLCRVQTSARGIVLRSEVFGSEIRTKKQQVCKAGDFLVAEIDAKMGGYGIVPEDLEGAIVSSHYFLYDIIEDKLDKTYLEFFTQTPRFFEQVKAEGSTNYAAIRPTHVLTYEIPLPPLSEQQRIAGRLAALKGKIDAVRALRGEQVREVERVKSDFLNRLFDELGKEFGVVDFNKIVDLKHGFQFRDFHFREKGIPVVKIGQIKPNGTLDLANCSYVSNEDAKQFTNFQIFKDDLLMALTGGTLGKVCYVKQDYGTVLQNYRVGKFEIKNDHELNKDYLYHVLTSSYFLNQVFGKINQAAQPNIGKAEMEKTRIPLPPIAEQRRIVSEIKAFQTKMDALKAEQAGQLSALEGLFPGVLEQAFRGEW